MDVGRCVEADAGMAVVGVVPNEEAPAEGLRIFERTGPGM
jgi:hypothetical protein